MTPYDPTVIASSTAVVGQGAAYLFATIWGFMPIVLTIVIPLGLLYGGYRLLRGKAHVG